MTLEVIASHGKDGVATVFVGRTQNGKLIEFAESLQPHTPIEKKWVIIVSVMHGCPVQCLMCDAGSASGGNLSQKEILEQVNYIVGRRFPGKQIPVEKWKVQFTRMGEPAFNDNVLDVLECLPLEYDAPGIIPSFSTIAPSGKEKFFERLLRIKNRLYNGGRFQLQFSIHTSDTEKRNRLIPAKKWDFEEIAGYGARFFERGDRKITLNFALMKGYTIEPRIIAHYFDPEKFLIKLTPLNPTSKAEKNGLFSAMTTEEINPARTLTKQFQSFGFDTIVSIGNLEENQIGSNCGQFISSYRR